MQVQDWLDKNYPQEKRSEVRKIYLNEPSLEGELDLSDFASKWLRVYISLAVDETKLIFKNQGERVEVIKCVIAQTWLEENYSQNGVCQRETDIWGCAYENKGKTRIEITKLDIRWQNLEGELDLSDFVNLKDLYCSSNKLTSLNLSNCEQLEKIECSDNLLTNFTLPINSTNLKKLNLISNNFPATQNLSFLTSATNLEILNLGNNDEEKIKQNIYNRFTSSLDYCSGMEKLKELDIRDTDINEINIEQLPKSLERIRYFTEYRPNCQLTTIIPQLDKYFGWFNRCLKCLQINTSQDWCQRCVDQEWKQDLEQLTGQELIEKFIEKRPVDWQGEKTKLQWIPYQRFTNIEYLVSGGFSEVHKATWKEAYTNQEGEKEDIKVALKILTNSQNITLEFLTEIANTKLVDDGNVVPCHGISQDQEGNYIMVMDYMAKGNLRDYCKNNAQELTWQDKLRKLENIARGLSSIHWQNLVHRDLHSGNILNNYYISCITDLGLSKPANSQVQVGKIFGVLPYVAPEVLQGKPYTQASDVYSFGIIAYEICSGLPPYYDKPFGLGLSLKICEGLRPQFQIKIPQFLEDLISKCWDVDPKKRPSAKELERTLDSWHKEIKDKKDTEFKQQLQATEAYNQTLPQEVRFPSYEIHPQVSYISKPINTKQITEQLSQEFHGSTEIPDIVDFLDNVTNNEVINNESVNWTNINPSFTSSLIQHWQSLNFTHKQAQEWINTNSLTQQTQVIQEPTYYAWLRDVKNFTSEKLLNYSNESELKREFAQWNQAKLQTQIAIPPK